MDPQTGVTYPRSVPQVPPTTYKLRLEAERLEAWKKSAETAGLKLAEWIRRRCDANGDAKNGVGIRDLGVVGRRAGASRRDVRGVSEEILDRRVRRVPEADAIPQPVAPPTLEDVAEETVTKRKEYGSLEHRVARRTGHPVGHECLQCVGAYRFEQDLERREKKEAKPQKQGSR